jgi:putative ABC transport system permease protein
MTFYGMTVRNFGRDRLRGALTVFGVATATATFLLLRTVMSAWGSSAALAARDRIVTRHKVTFTMMVPKRYVERVRSAPHVSQATWATWFGGKDPRHDRDFFATYTVDPESYFRVYNEAVVAPEQLDAWKHDRRGAIVGEVLARRLGCIAGPVTGGAA